MNPQLNIDLTLLEEELRKRIALPEVWHYKYIPQYEEQIAFVYDSYKFDQIQSKLNRLPREVKRYGLNRWYNFWSNQAILQIFALHPKVNRKISEENSQDLFTIQYTDFKIKSLVFPYSFSRTLRYAISHKEELVYWLYRKFIHRPHQQGHNAIFIIFYHRNGEHWKLKAQLSGLKRTVHSYLDNFDLYRLLRIHFPDNRFFYTDVLWFIEGEDE